MKIQQAQPSAVIKTNKIFIQHSQIKPKVKKPMWNSDSTTINPGQ